MTQAITRIRCEERGEHTAHRISEHTIAHALAGNRYTCEAISPEYAEQYEAWKEASC